jgi:hypothetical protein
MPAETPPRSRPRKPRQHGGPIRPPGPAGVPPGPAGVPPGPEGAPGATRAGSRADGPGAAITTAASTRPRRDSPGRGCGSSPAPPRAGGRGPAGARAERGASSPAMAAGTAGWPERSLATAGSCPPARRRIVPGCCGTIRGLLPGVAPASAGVFSLQRPRPGAVRVPGLTAARRAFRVYPLRGATVVSCRHAARTGPYPVPPRNSIVSLTCLFSNVTGAAMVG